MRHRDGSRERRGGMVHSRGCVRVVSFHSSISDGWSIIVMEEDWKRTNVEGGQIVTTEADDLEARPSRSHHMLTERSLVAELPTRIPNVGHHVLAQESGVLSDLLVRKNS